jgi:hypothetical protein
MYGNIQRASKGFSIRPEIIIGTGLVEFEELIEYSKNKLNMRLFNLTICLVGISLLHLSYKTFKN